VGKRTSRRTISPNTLKFGVLSFGLISGQFSSDGSSGPKHALHSLQRRMGHWAGLWDPPSSDFEKLTRDSTAHYRVEQHRTHISSTMLM
jgi:hypothetical protein